MILDQLVRRGYETYSPSYFLLKSLKKEAVRLVQSESLTVAEAARKLEVAPKSLKTWISLKQQGTLTGSLGVAKLTLINYAFVSLNANSPLRVRKATYSKKPLRTLRNCRSEVRHDCQIKNEPTIQKILKSCRISFISRFIQPKIN